MNRFPILIRREFWEHRAAFVTMPLVMIVLVVSVLGLGYLVLDAGMIKVEVENDGNRLQIDGSGGAVIVTSSLMELETMSPDERRHHITRVFWFASGQFYIVLCFVTFFYLLDTLYEDRKDRSVLFWKSMPVSDAQTVTAKLLTAAFALPLVYVGAAIVVQLLLLLMAVAIAAGHDVPVWETLLVPSMALPAVWFSMLVYVVYMALWALPYYGWLLLVSAAARSVPFIWAVGVPVVLIILDGVLVADTDVAIWMADHMVPMASISTASATLSGVMGRLFSVDFAVATLLGGLFIYGAIRCRGTSDEI
ncbi:MAG: hypothetical protein O2780_03000 [Proteobacteria bacterium]|jgi:ABC-2 type transport system permease protein|nr:hypothetical protein [Pseudomonadota bacterium]MDA1301196.1 hypothetical protein [Pseudomonadota bacterium]